MNELSLLGPRKFYFSGENEIEFQMNYFGDEDYNLVPGQMYTVEFIVVYDDNATFINERYSYNIVSIS